MHSTVTVHVTEFFAYSLSSLFQLDEFPPPAMSRVYALNQPELPIIIVGVIAAMLQGAIFPSLAVLFGEVLAVSLILLRSFTQQVYSRFFKLV